MTKNQGDLERQINENQHPLITNGLPTEQLVQPSFRKPAICLCGSLLGGVVKRFWVLAGFLDDLMDESRMVISLG